MAVEEPKKLEHSNQFYVLAPTAFRAKARRTEYRQAHDPETEVWRACQKSSIAMEVKVRLILAVTFCTLASCKCANAPITSLPVTPGWSNSFWNSAQAAFAYVQVCRAADVSGKADLSVRLWRESGFRVAGATFSKMRCSADRRTDSSVEAHI
jgi:hypothetical protein